MTSFTKHEKGQGRDKDIRVRSSIGHGKKEGLFMRELEVFVCEFLAIDGFPAGSLNHQVMISVKSLLGTRVYTPARPRGM